MQCSSVVPSLFEHIITDHVKQSWCVGVEVCDIPYSGGGNAGLFFFGCFFTTTNAVDEMERVKLGGGASHTKKNLE